MKTGTGPDPERRKTYTGCKDWKRTGIHKNRTVLYEDGVTVIFWSLGGILHLQARTIHFVFCPKLTD